MTVADRLRITAKCLLSSLEKWKMLWQVSIAATVRIGLRIDANDANAWVEVNGRPLTEHIDDSTMITFELAEHLPPQLVGRAA